MRNLTRIGIIISFFLLLGVNSNSVSGLCQIEARNSKNVRNPSEILSVANQDGSEFLPENSTWTDYPLDDDHNGLYDRFLEVVKNSRTSYTAVDRVKEIADGRIFTAKQALELGLIDEITKSG